MFKNCDPFSDCINKIDNKQLDSSNDINVVMPIDNLIEYSDNYSKTLRNFWEYYRDKPVSNDAGSIVDFAGNSASD